jgi:endonuclease/exonuclease/phosphatase family metal-dependent hydrolase
MLKRIIYALIIIIPALLIAGCGTNTPLVPPTNEAVLEFGSASTLDVVTWNLRTFPLSESSIETIAQIVPQMKADIIAFQEIMDPQAFYNLDAQIPNYSAYVYSATDTYRLAFLYDTRTITVNDVYTIYETETNPFPRAPYVFDCNYQGQRVIVIDNHLKAYGDNNIDENDPWDEEYRRRLACQLLDQYISENFPDEKVIVVGDFNDQIAEPPAYNIFMSFLDKPDQYAFADMSIAQNPTSTTVSYPSSNSHIDHVLLTNELFTALADTLSQCKVIRVDEYMGNWANYSNQISDHRPLGVKLHLQ